jgi:hypothetical protein
MYIVEAGLKSEARVPVPGNPREQVPSEGYSMYPSSSRPDSCVRRDRLKTRDVWFLVTVMSEGMYLM